MRPIKQISFLILMMLVLSIASCEREKKDTVFTTQPPQLHIDLFNKIINSPEMSRIGEVNNRICFRRTDFLMIDEKFVSTLKNVVIVDKGNVTPERCCAISEVNLNPRNILIGVSCFGSGGKFLFSRANINEEYQLEKVDIFER